MEERLPVEKSGSRKNKKSKKNKKNKMNRKDRGGCYQGGLVCYEELPEYMKENEFIRGYYRSEWTLSHAFFSLFSWHNETINVWTHLIGFFIFVGLTMLHLREVPQLADLLSHLPWSFSSSARENVSCNPGSFFSVSASSLTKPSSPSQLLNITTSPPPADRAARWPFLVFMAGSMFCLLSSSACHLLCCHSRRLNLLLARLDYAGIAIMIVASFFPPIYYIFQCDPQWRLAYLATITAFGAATVFTLFSPEVSRGKFRGYRAALFAAMGCSGIVPAVHATIANWSEPRRDVTLAWEGVMAAAYLTGTLFYVSRVPERWRPGAFDIAGHSHQIFHLLVIAGALAHYGAALVFIEWRDVVSCGQNLI